MKKYDIVYVLRNDITVDELRYSLRSVVKNFDYKRIWFYGGCPKGIVPDVYVPFRQDGDTKWQRTRSMYRHIMANDEITSNFWLFNDDFFIMRRYNPLIPISNGTIYGQAYRIEKIYGCRTGYTKRLRRAASFLEDCNIDHISYETHTPMLINRDKALDILTKFDEDIAIFRSTYGNYYNIGGRITKDSKISQLYKMPTGNEPILSTSDESFNNGFVGAYIRQAFQTPCKYEVEESEWEYYIEEAERES